jgi:hypothetical protein
MPRDGGIGLLVLVGDYFFARFVCLFARLTRREESLNWTSYSIFIYTFPFDRVFGSCQIGIFGSCFGLSLQASRHGSLFLQRLLT